MGHFVPIILWGWIPASLLFWRWSAANAVLIALLGGWALLPVADFAAMPPERRVPDWVMGMALPGATFLTKATASALAALVGVILFDARRLLQLRPRWYDLPILLWCCSPLFSGIGGGTDFSSALRDTAYLFVAWGVPYAMGRMYFSDLAGQKRLAIAIVLAGMALVPACLVEIPSGPSLYAALYGYHPYQEIGVTRYIGNRPMVLLEDGNQLGMWMAGAALVAAWLWLAGALPRLGRIAPWVAALLLVAITVACQSVGAIILLAAGIAILYAMHRIHVRVIGIGLVVCVVLFLAVRVTGVWSVQQFAKSTQAGQTITRWVKSTGRGSVGWRLKMEEQNLSVATRHPVVGAGRTDWWRENGGGRPWGLWLLAFGAYGAVGLVSLHLIFLLPGFTLVRHIPPHSWHTPAFAAPAALAMLVFVSMVDNLLNSGFILPTLLAAGALSRPELLKTAEGTVLPRPKTRNVMLRDASAVAQ